jgi:hypothetical protein
VYALPEILHVDPAAQGALAFTPPLKSQA